MKVDGIPEAEAAACGERPENAELLTDEAAFVVDGFEFNLGCFDAHSCGALKTGWTRFKLTAGPDAVPSGEALAAKVVAVVEEADEPRSNWVSELPGERAAAA